MPPTGSTTTPSTVTVACSAHPERLGDDEVAAQRDVDGGAGARVLPGGLDEQGAGRRLQAQARRRDEPVAACCGGADAPHLPAVTRGDALQPLGRVEPMGHLGDDAGAHREEVGRGVGEERGPGRRVTEHGADPGGDLAVGVGHDGQGAHDVGGLAPDEPVARTAVARGDEEGARRERALGLLDRDGRPRVAPGREQVPSPAQATPTATTSTREDRGGERRPPGGERRAPRSPGPRESRMPSTPRARDSTSTRARGRSRVPDHSVIGSPAPSTPAGTVPRRTEGATRAAASRTGASRASDVAAVPQARPRASASTPTTTSGSPVHTSGEPAPPGASRASCHGCGRRCRPTAPGPRRRRAPATRPRPPRTTRARARRRGRRRRPTRGRGPRRRPRRAPARGPTTTASSTGANAPSTTAARAWRTRSSPWSVGSRRSQSPEARNGRRTRATTAPSRPWATEAAATPVVAHAKAASPGPGGRGPSCGTR